MNRDLELFDMTWRFGDRARARDLAREYVTAHRERLSGMLASYTLEDIVRLVEAYRDKGDVENRIVADMWLLAEYEPQYISGQVSIGPAAVAEMVADAFRDSRP